MKPSDKLKKYEEEVLKRYEEEVLLNRNLPKKMTEDEVRKECELFAKQPQLEMVNVPRKGRHYYLPDYGLPSGLEFRKMPVPSVTNVQGIVDKPALMWWAGDTERQMVIEKALTAFRLLGPRGTDTDEDFKRFEEIFRMAIPKQPARFAVSKKATNIGIEGHSLIQWNSRAMLGEKENKPKVSASADRSYAAWELWAEAVNFEPLLVEQTVYSAESGFRDAQAGLGCAGTLDSFSLHDWPEPGERRFFVDDWKTSSISKSQPNGIYPESKLQVSVYAQMLIDLGVAPENTMGCVVRLPKNEDDPVLTQDDRAVDHVEIMQETRRELAAEFVHVVKTWQLMKNRLA